MTANDAAERAANSTFALILYRFGTPILLAVIGWFLIAGVTEVRQDISTLQQRVTATELAQVKIEAQFNQIKGQLTDLGAAMTAMGLSRTEFQNQVIGRLTGVEVEMRGLRADINRLFDERPKPSYGPR